MHFDIESLWAGMFICAFLYCVIRSAQVVLKYRKMEVLRDEHLGAIRDILAAQTGILEGIRRELPTGDALLSCRDEIVCAINVLDSKAHPLSIDLAQLDELLRPIRETLFRIATDTELSRKKFDVLHKLLGIDEKMDAARYVEENPEDDRSMFNTLVEELMTKQGLSWAAASHEVKARLAHRSVGR